ncbi:MAG: DNA repair protein RecO [Paracoccaceae bacterium]
MEWRDQGIVLRSRPHGESACLLEVFTPARGRHAGIVRGGASRRTAPLLQPGAQLDVTWKARLEDHVGSFTIEPVRSRSAVVMQDRLALEGLNTVTALLLFALPERETHSTLYSRTEALLDLLGQSDIWPLAYMRWEMALLDALGYGMDLSACALTGANDHLAYVSPRTGRAVTASAAGEWADRLLPLPPCMLGEGTGPDHEVAEAFRTTGHFLHHRLAPAVGDAPLPEARQRFLDRFAKGLA